MTERKRGYAACMWSEVHGRWFAVMRTEVRSRAAGIAEQLAYWGWIDVEVVEAPSVDHSDIVAAMDLLRPPRFAEFVDPAPEGIIEPVGELNELCELVCLEVEFQKWKALSPFAKRRSAAVDEALRWSFVNWELEARDRAASREFDRLADRAGGLGPVAKH